MITYSWSFPWAAAKGHLFPNTYTGARVSLCGSWTYDHPDPRPSPGLDTSDVRPCTRPACRRCLRERARLFNRPAGGP
jgi:hypothetical protein